MSRNIQLINMDVGHKAIQIAFKADLRVLDKTQLLELLDLQERTKASTETDLAASMAHYNKRSLGEIGRKVAATLKPLKANKKPMKQRLIELEEYLLNYDEKPIERAVSKVLENLERVMKLEEVKSNKSIKDAISAFTKAYSRVLDRHESKE